MDPYAWTLDAEALVLVPALAIAYAVALRRFPAQRWRIACFAGGVVLLLAASITPVATLSLHYLLSAHLLQNVVFAEWAPALLVLGVPPALARAPGRVAAFHVLTHPLVALPLWLATYFVWHLPWAYDAALEHQATLLHLEHFSYLASGVLLWWPALQGEPHSLAPGTVAGYLFAAFIFASPLGLLLALLPEAVYSFYEQAPRLWGLTPLADQRLAGVTMAAEQAVVFFAAFSVFFLRFLRAEEGVLATDR